MEKHYVVFYSPGTLFAESTSKEIDSWDIAKAIEMSKTVVERYGAKPYSFVFTTRSRTDDELDSKETARSPNYYLGGTIKTLDEIEAENDDSNRILISNMKSMGVNKVVVNTNSYKATLPLYEGDVVLNV